MKQKALPRAPLYWYLTIVIILVITVMSCIVIGVFTSNRIKQSLLYRSETMSRLIPASTIAKLEGNESDLENPAYQELKDNFMNVVSVNPDVRFIYLLALDKDNHSFFYVDSEDPANTEDYSPPGQSYPEGDADVINSYGKKAGEVLPITSDRWGNWLSAFSPILDKNGNVVAILGLDVSANYYYRTVAIYSMIPVLVATILLLILFWIRHRILANQRYLYEKAFFLSFASHEIRSPLTAISHAIDKLPETMRSKAEIKQIHSSLDRTLNIIDDVLSLQATEGLRQRGAHRKPTRIHDIVKDTIGTLGLLADQRNIKVVDRTAPTNHDMMVNIDPLLFERVISNFLVNAIKYSPENSDVEVEVTEAADSWSIQFHNGGNPIPEAEQKRLLQGFYRTKQARESGQKGSGLGMILARDIISQHKGQLSLESSEGKGVTFIITIPR